MSKLWSPEEEKFLRDNYHILGPSKVALKLGRTINGIRTFANKKGIVKRERVARGYGNIAPIGYERPDQLGYIMVKVANRVWRLKQRLVWEKYYGERPKGCIEFIDGDRTNCDITNLRLTSPKEQLKKNSVNNLPEELRSLVFLKGQLTRLIKRKRKEENEHNEST